MLSSQDPQLAPLEPFVPGRIQKASLTQDGRLVLELFGARKVWLVIAPTHATHPIALVDDKPERDETPPGAQRVVRDALANERLIDVIRDRSDVIQFVVQTVDERPRTIFVELGNDPRLVLTAAKAKDADEKILVVVGGDVKTKDGRDLRRGQRYVAPKSEPPAPVVIELVGASTAPRPVQKRDSALQTLRQQLKARHRRYSRLVQALRGDLARHGDPVALRRDGDALKSLLSSNTPLPARGTPSVKIVDDTGERDVALEPTLDVVGNLEALYRRARRATAGRAQVQPRLDDAEAQLVEIERVRAAILVDTPTDANRERAQSLTEETSDKGARRKAAATASRRPFRAFLCTGDVVVRVGRSAKDNDALTFHVAAGNDIWMHAREVAGSHVIFAAPAEVPQELLLDAAHLAAWFSPLSKDDRIDVQWTRRKYIRKPGKGAPAGFVHITKEKVLHLVVDEARTKAILAREVQGEVRTKSKRR